MSDTNICVHAAYDSGVIPQLFDTPGNGCEHTLEQMKDALDTGETEPVARYHVLYKSGKVPFAFLGYLVDRLNTSGQSVVVYDHDYDKKELIS
jgi:hypothetical protein